MLFGEADVDLDSAPMSPPLYREGPCNHLKSFKHFPPDCFFFFFFGMLFKTAVNHGRYVTTDM